MCVLRKISDDCGIDARMAARYQASGQDIRASTRILGIVLLCMKKIRWLVVQASILILNRKTPKKSLPNTGLRNVFSNTVG